MVPPRVVLRTSEGARDISASSSFKRENTMMAIIVFSLLNELEADMSLAPSLVRRTTLGGTIHMLVGDSNPRYLAR